MGAQSAKWHTLAGYVFEIHQSAVANIFGELLLNITQLQIYTILAKGKFSPWTDESISGKRFEARAAFVLRFRGDKVYEISEYYDRGAIVKQLTA